MPTRVAARKQHRLSDENSEAFDSFDTCSASAHDRRMSQHPERAAVRAFLCGAQVAISWMREDGGCWVELVSSAA
jgi:hypothetical protein